MASRTKINADKPNKVHPAPPQPTQRDLGLIDQIRSLFNAESNPSDTVAALAQSTVSITNADWVWVRNFGIGGELKIHPAEFASKWNYDRGLLKAIDLGCGRVFCSSVPDYCADSSNLVMKDSEGDPLTSAARSILIVPLVTDQGVEGFVIAASLEPNCFDNYQITSVQAVAEFGAVALARLSNGKTITSLKGERDKALDQVVESEQRFRATLSAVRDGMIIRDLDGTIQYANVGASRILDFPIDQLFTGHPEEEWLLVDESRAVLAPGSLPDRAAIETRQQQPEITRGIERSDGTVTWLLVSAGPVFMFGQSEPFASVLSFSDITERKTSFDTNARLAAVVDSSQDAIICVTLDGIVVSWNPGAEKLFGYTALEAIGLESQVLTPPHDRKSFKQMVDLLASGEHDEGCECIRFRKDGVPVHVSLTHSLVRNSKGDPIAIAAIARDVTDRVRYEEKIKAQLEQINEINEELQAQQEELVSANEQLAKLATMDGLTMLKNHRYFQERLHEEVQRSLRYNVPLSMFILDVDSFKEYNDTYGHPAGDEVLRSVSQILTTNCRASDVVSRYGGEEFVVILPQTPAEGAAIIAERCRKVIEQYAWPLRKITASFGVSTLNDNCRTAAEIIGAGDNAMYTSKRSGKNQVTHAMNVGAKKKTQKKAA